MKKCSKILTMVLSLICALGTAAFAQQDTTVTSEAIGPLSGSVLVISPPGPSTCVSPDTVNFTGNVHVVAQVDTVANTVDVHINLMTVKGTGQNGKYIGNGATSMLSLPAGISPGPINFAADLHPPNPCRAGFTSQGALQITVRLTFAADNTLATVSAVAGTAGN